ncbi:hypothetical protein ACPV5O_21195 [Vibrio maritimus]|uniref:hypothetical protein n=1 Tax=Vibrio maritimus TaxID=990268 RepID=UPI0040694236
MNKYCVVPLFATLALSGCVSQPNGVGAFAKATEGITTQVDQVLADVNDGKVTLELQNIAADTGSGARMMSPKDFDRVRPVFTEKDKKKMALYRANEALTNYAKGLQSLAEASTQNDIDLAVANLSVSMNSANKSYVELSGKQELFSKDDATIVYTAIAAIGTNYAESKRREALKEIIVEADPKIQIITQEIIDSLDDSGVEGLLRTQRSGVYANLISDYNVQVNARKAKGELPFTLKEAQAYTDEIFAAYTKMEATKVDLSKTRKSLLAIKKAHEALAMEVSKDTFDGPRVMSIVGELSNQWKHYGDYRDLISECDGKWELEDAEGVTENTKPSERKVISCKVPETKSAER